MRTDAPGSGTAALPERECVVIPVVEERLEVGTREVESGAVRLRKIVHQEAVNIEEPLTVEFTEVERVVIDRPIDVPVAVRYEGDVMIVPVVEERIVTFKQLVLVEEIRVTRRTRVESARGEVTLRREEVLAERLDPASGEWKRVEADSDHRL